MRVFSFGGGVQSMAVLVLAAQQRVQYDYFLFCNVGHDSENPATLRYVEEVAKPYAARHGIGLVELQRTVHGQPITLLADLYRSQRTINIPVRMATGMPGNRNCTAEFKIKLVAKWTKQHGATPDHPATVGIGFSTDEIQRLKESRIDWQVNEYPLLDNHLSRRDCMALIVAAGLPVPPKSSCWFCPFKKREDWRALKREQPELFDRAVELERHLNDIRTDLGRDQVYLHSSLVPLDRAVGDQTDMFAAFEDDFCDTGYCLV